MVSAEQTEEIINKCLELDEIHDKQEQYIQELDRCVKKCNETAEKIRENMDEMIRRFFEIAEKIGANVNTISEFVNEYLELSAERNAIMSEPDKLSQDDLIFPPLDDELKTEGD